MALVIPPNYSNWTITLTNASGGSSAESSVSCGAATNGLLTQTDVNRVANIWRDGLKAGWDSGWTVGPVHVVENDSGVYKVWDDNTQEAGTATAAVYSPPSVSIIVSKNTGLRGRAHRGRMYMPGVVETSVGEDGRLDSGYVTAWQTLVDNLHTALLADASIFSLSLLHSETSPVANDPDILENFHVQTVVGTMRPRQRR